MTQFRKDRFNIHFVSPLGNVVSQVEMERIIEKDRQTEEGRLARERTPERRKMAFDEMKRAAE